MQSNNRFLLIHGLIGIILIFVVAKFSDDNGYRSGPEYIKAAELMQESLDLISSYCTDNNINTDKIRDPYYSGLIGPEMSEITTTIGHLEAKRSTINPNFASLIVGLLKDAGVKQGDTIAIGSSGSFPALLIASLSAAIAMDIHPMIIMSIGSSSYGANNIDFNLTDIFSLLYDNNIVDFKPVAVSLGGEKDIGEEFESYVVDKLRSDITELGVPLLNESNLEKNVCQRELFYFLNKDSGIKAFINTGGSFSNMGTSALSLKLIPGLIFRSTLPPVEKRGMIFTMLANKIPVIHLLYIKGIVQEYNLAWDPVSIPKYRDNPFKNNKVSPAVLIISILTLIYFAYFLFSYNKNRTIK